MSKQVNPDKDAARKTSAAREALDPPAGARAERKAPASRPIAPQANASLTPRRRVKTIILIAGGCLLLMANVGFLWWSGGKFWTAAPSKHGNPPPLESIRAPRPKSPSVAELKLKVPTLAPGLEEVDPAYAPSSSADLMVLVYSGRGVHPRDYDLYLTRRDGPSARYSTPVRIQSCSSPQYETFPSLSPDGLELLFLRFEAKPTLYYARRESVDHEFGDAIPWAVSESLPTGRLPGGPQFIDMQYVQFVTRGETPTKDRQIVITKRDEPKGSFQPPSPLDFTDAPVPQFVSANRMRTYYGVPNGLFMAARTSDTAPFGVPARIIEVPADGPVWVAPQEDVLIYCSPGFGQLMESSRRLWMLRF